MNPAQHAMVTPHHVRNEFGGDICHICSMSVTPGGIRDHHVSSHECETEGLAHHYQLELTEANQRWWLVCFTCDVYWPYPRNWLPVPLKL